MTYSKSKKMREMGPTRTAQHCAQCTAHGRISLLKGHKKVCPFKHCRCVHCMLVNNKRQIMAKQVKLKRLQEKTHSRQRRSEQNKTSFRGQTPVATSQTQEKKLAYLDGTGISEMQHYQEEAWRVICGQNNDPQEQTYRDQQGGSPRNGWPPVSPVQYSHTGPLQQLHNPTSSGSIMFQPCYPTSSPTAAMNLFATPVGEPEVFPLNHVFTQPVYYQCIQPDCTQSVSQTNQISAAGVPEEILLQPLEVVGPFGEPANMAAAETLLTLRTGEE